MSEQRSSGNQVVEVKAEELRVICDVGEFRFETTADVEPLEGIIGQERALRAIEFGLGMQSFGYNIFVAGTPGTGKKTLIRSLVERIAKEKSAPVDLFCVMNFDRPESPRVLQVPPGVGRRFSGDMALLVETLLDEVPKAFKSEDYEERKKLIIEKFQETRGALIERLQREARERNLAVKTSGTQIVTVPVVNGAELTPEQFAALPPEAQATIQKNQAELSETVGKAYHEIRQSQLATQERIRDLDRTAALIAAGHYLDELRKEYAEQAEILKYLEQVQSDVIDNIALFLPEAQGEEGRSDTDDVSVDPLRRYRVNVIVDNESQQGAPVVTETHPTYRNLIGYAEREAKMGTLSTDFTMIRAGSILAANGGYLILDLVDVLSAPMAWEALKRVLQDGEVKIQDPTDQYGMVSTVGMRPKAIKVDLKVIILGRSNAYNLLYGADEDFQKLFKIKAEFDTVLRKSDGHLKQYARFVRTLCDKEDLRQFDGDAVARLIEHSSRMVSDKTRLTLRFSDVADLIRESNYWAGQASKMIVGREEVEKSIQEKIFRSNLYEQRLQEMIDEGNLLIETSGEIIGQINGLSVFQVGDFAFGKPTRLTAQVSVGEKGVVNIEREARLSGRIHDKGVLILSGYLNGKYGQQFPLSLNASICFEQSYSGVDGDSASSTELYAILSSLAGLPIRQSIAVTGSINQKGMIQPIGGVNEKVEGFFDTCRSRGLNGSQGVIIPYQNVQNLVLKQAVVEEVRSGKFHIYQIGTVDEGLEILTGFEAGKVSDDGSYPEGTIHFLAQQRLKEMSEKVQRLYRGPRPTDTPV